MGMRRLGKNAVLALREPSLGPVFGVKGGGTGGGKASLTPADDINLHFTGDIHAITTAHNLLSALVDNAVYFGDVIPDKGEIDPRQVTWGRALDMNDRFLRRCIVGLGGKAQRHAARGALRHHRRERGHGDHGARQRITPISRSASRASSSARRTRARPSPPATSRRAGAMTAVLRDALKPNLVQTEEGGPAIVHCGPFGNIAHGCNSVVATRLAMNLGDYAITEAGFGFDLGGEKFLDIKCRQAGIWPRALVLVATLRALKMHGGAPVKTCGEPDAEQLEEGHRAPREAPRDRARLRPQADRRDQRLPERHRGRDRDGRGGGRRARRAARALRGLRQGRRGRARPRARRRARSSTRPTPRRPRHASSTSSTDTPEEKIRKIAHTVYGAKDVHFTGSRGEEPRSASATLGYARLPICMAKTQLSLTDDPTVFGRPRDFTITVREVRLSAGAGFLVAAHRRHDDDARPPEGAGLARASSSSPTARSKA